MGIRLQGHSADAGDGQGQLGQKRDQEDDGDIAQKQEGHGGPEDLVELCLSDPHAQVENAGVGRRDAAHGQVDAHDGGKMDGVDAQLGDDGHQQRSADENAGGVVDDHTYKEQEQVDDDHQNIR